MSNLSRRAVLSGASVVAGTGALSGAAGATEAARAEDGPAGDAPLATVRPGDDRYDALVVGHNRRFVASPEAVHLIRTTDQAVTTVAEAVRAGKRLSLRSGGHCYGDLVYHGEAEVILDLSTMKRIAYDPARRAFMIEPGAHLGEIYEALYRRWGVTLPGGLCPYVGIGGHASGGGYGFLNRRCGVVADHIEAVEVVVADADAGGQPRAVIASRESTGDLRELWWAIAGGGGGSFGVVTRYWFRSAGATGTDPAAQLPQPPSEMLLNFAALPWQGLDEATFTTLLRNFGRWWTRHSDAESPYTRLSADLLVRPSGAGEPLMLVTLAEATEPGAEDMLAAFLAEMGEGVPGLVAEPYQRLGWLPTARLMGTMDPPSLMDLTQRIAAKTAFMRAPLTPGQCAAVYASMTRADYANPTANFILTAMGGQINAVAPDAIAYPHRSPAYLTLLDNFWTEPGEDDLHLTWMRDLYGTLFADTGGYPVPNDRTDGCYINSPDPDILDPAYNASGVPWHDLYFKDNYPRLQRAKRRWDPADVFRHPQSVRLPAS